MLGVLRPYGYLYLLLLVFCKKFLKGTPQLTIFPFFHSLCMFCLVLLCSFDSGRG